MPTSYKQVYSGLIAFALLMQLVGCVPNQRAPESTDFVDSILQNAGFIADSSGANRALIYLDSSLNGVALNGIDRVNVFESKYNVYQDFLHDHTKAILYADSMIATAIEVKADSTILFRAYLEKANSLYDAEAFKEAFQYFEKTRGLVVARKTTCDEFPFIFRIAMSLYREEMFLRAANMFSRAYAVSGNCSDENPTKHFRQQEVLSNIGLSYGKVGMQDSAIFYFDSALRFISRLTQKYYNDDVKWKEAASVVYGNMGTAYRQTGQYDSAKLCFEKSIAISEDADRNELDRQFNMLKLADLCLYLREYDSAFALIKQSEQLHEVHKADRKASDNLEYEYRRSQVLHRYYSMVGDNVKSLNYLTLYDSLKNKRSLQVSKIQKNDLLEGINNFSREKDLLSLQKDLKIRKQQNVILFLTFVLSLGGLVLIIYLLKQHKKKYQKLELKNQKITKESAEKEQILKRKMRQDELNFIALIENTDDFLWSVDAGYRLLAFNNAYREYNYQLFGTYPEIGKREIANDREGTLYKLVWEGYRFVFKEGKSCELTGKDFDVSGQEADIEIRLKPITNQTGDVVGVSCFRRDVTESKKLIRGLELSNEHLTSIAWVQSHKLRGPLSTMLGICNLILDDSVPAEQKDELLVNLKEKAEEMDQIIHELVGMTEKGR